MVKSINRLKIVLAEKMISNKWVSEQLGCSQAAVSKWCTNTSQPGLETATFIAKALDIELGELVKYEED